MTILHVDQLGENGGFMMRFKKDFGIGIANYDTYVEELLANHRLDDGVYVAWGEFGVSNGVPMLGVLYQIVDNKYQRGTSTLSAATNNSHTTQRIHVWPPKSQ